MSAAQLIDYEGRSVRLTAERWEHILLHPEMEGQRPRLVETLSGPDTVIATEKDPDVRAYHRLYDRTPVTRKYLVVAIKVLPEDAFVLTAYFTSRVRRGTVLWQK